MRDEYNNANEMCKPVPEMEGMGLRDGIFHFFILFGLECANASIAVTTENLAFSPGGQVGSLTADNLFETGRRGRRRCRPRRDRQISFDQYRI